MPLDAKDIEIGYELPSISKHITQAKMNAYEACGKRSYRGIHELATGSGHGGPLLRPRVPHPAAPGNWPIAN